MRFTIAKKVYGIVGFALVVLLGVAGVGYYGLTSQSEGMEQLFTGNVRMSDISQECEILQGDAIHYYKNYLIRKDDKYVAKFREAIGKIGEDLQEYMKLARTEAEKAAGQQALKELEGYKTAIDQLAAERGKSDNIAAVDKAIKGTDKPLHEALVAMNQLTDKLAAASKKESLHMATVLRYTMLGAALGAAVLLAFFGFAMATSIINRVNRFAVVISQVAQNDLSVRVDFKGDDEIVTMGEQFNRMLDTMNSTISSITSTAVQVASASNQLSSTAEQIATGAEEVACQSGTVATAGEEMAATSAEIAQNCNMAAEASKAANEKAVAGAQVVQDTVNGMNQIAERVKETATTVESLGSRSDQIGEIVGTIEDIADQTNLLALNAAIEAARAGEQGRGFAVVADEVRALAERTTRATKEISDMIKAIQQETKGAVSAMEEGVQEVAHGTEKAAKSGDAISEILNQINTVTMQVNQIATAAEEQTATTGEISSNIQQITAVVQETAKGAQDSASAAHDLAGLAQELQRLVAQFKLAA